VIISHLSIELLNGSAGGSPKFQKNLQLNTVAPSFEILMLDTMQNKEVKKLTNYHSQI